MKRFISLFAVSVLLFIVPLGTPAQAKVTPAQAKVTSVTINNGPDLGYSKGFSRFGVDGNGLDLHDGSVLKVGSLYYLYGTSYACGYLYNVNSKFCGFKAWTTPDFVNFTDRGFVIAPSSCGYCFRPHVVYNASTQKYVMWISGKSGQEVYTNPSPTGLFTRSPNPNTRDAQYGDMDLFVDDDGTGYVIAGSPVHTYGRNDVAVEKLTPDYLQSTGEYRHITLGDGEALTVFKRNGRYHMLMGDPGCAYCNAETGYLTSKSMLGVWQLAWYDPNAVDTSGSPSPRYRGRIVNPNSCGGQPMDTIAVAQADGSTQYLFIADRWDSNGNQSPGSLNQGLGNLYIGPMTFGADGLMENIQCVNSFSMTLPGNPATANTTPTRDHQSSGNGGFRHACDVAGSLQRQQTFTPSRTGPLKRATITSFQRNEPDAPLTIDLINVATNSAMYSKSFPAAVVPWSPQEMAIQPNVVVQAGGTYALRLRSSASRGCYGVEYNPSNPYSGGIANISQNGGASFDAEAWQDLKFTASIHAHSHPRRSASNACDRLATAADTLAAFGPRTG